jgi:hypothetical protein
MGAFQAAQTGPMLPRVPTVIMMLLLGQRSKPSHLFVTINIANGIVDGTIPSNLPSSSTYFFSHSHCYDEDVLYQDNLNKPPASLPTDKSWNTSPGTWASFAGVDVAGDPITLYAYGPLPGKDPNSYSDPALSCSGSLPSGYVPPIGNDEYIGQ